MDPSSNSLQMRACKPSIETFLHRADSLLIVAPHLINGLLHFEYERAAVERELPVSQPFLFDAERCVW